MFSLRFRLCTRPPCVPSSSPYAPWVSFRGLASVSFARRHTPLVPGPEHVPGPSRRILVPSVQPVRSIYATIAHPYEIETSEPGVDPRRESATRRYGHIQQECTIDVWDYSSSQYTKERMNNQTFIKFMQDPVASRRESWSKVRWINVGGVSWDVISALAIKHDLHPLALEDVIHTPRTGLPSKADYYAKHLFIRILCHSREKSEEHDRQPPLSLHSSELQPLHRAVHTKPKAPAPEETDHMKAWYDATTSALQASDRMHHEAEDEEDHSANGEAASSLSDITSGQRVNVKIEPMGIFLTRDGTLITINRNPDLAFTAPVGSWLQRKDTSLRTSSDPSLLLHALLDLTVDRALEVVDEYHSRIMKLEQDTLILPRMRVVRDLHILQGDLIQHRRTLEPIKKLLIMLMRHDDARSAMLLSDEEQQTDQPTKGFMSRNAEIYLADVIDHMDYILTSLNMFAKISENLIDYTFNMANHQMNQTMRRLTLVTIICLPLTILTGYFGMNFDPMPSVQENSELLFWQIAAPLMVVVVVASMYRDMGRKYRQIHRRILSARGHKMKALTERRYW